MADSSGIPATTPATGTGSATGSTKTTSRRVLLGVVTRDKMSKTRRVEVERLVRHPKYGKFVKRRTVCYAHDEANDSHLGDTVEIIESRPLSRLKRWALIKVVTRAPSRTLSNLEGAVAGSATPAPTTGTTGPATGAAPASRAEETKTEEKK